MTTRADLGASGTGRGLLAVTGKSGALAKSPAERMREYRARHRERVREMDRARDRSGRYGAAPEKRRAWNLVAAAVRRGKLVKQPCEVCGCVDVEGHHDDYSRPLDVRWLCERHHEEHHARERAVPAPFRRAGTRRVLREAGRGWTSFPLAPRFPCAPSQHLRPAGGLT